MPAHPTCRSTTNGRSVCVKIASTPRVQREFSRGLDQCHNYTGAWSALQLARSTAGSGLLVIISGRLKNGNIYNMQYVRYGHKASITWLLDVPAEAVGEEAPLALAPEVDNGQHLLRRPGEGQHVLCRGHQHVALGLAVDDVVLVQLGRAKGAGGVGTRIRDGGRQTFLA